MDGARLPNENASLAVDGTMPDGMEEEEGEVQPEPEDEEIPPEE